MFIDEAEIMVKGGHGGAGKVAFFRNRKGASGGNGGHGGSVYAAVNSNLTHLKSFIEISKYLGQNGGGGGDNKRTGLNGKDMIIQVPSNTTFIEISTGKEITLDEKNPSILLCHGGAGGLGNLAFKTSINRTPKTAEPGKEGEERQFKLILKLIANFGLIGLPNAGKSSLLNELTAANVKTANYPFTTLEPNLGVFDGKIIADVPGLIEGASLGRGLGIKFLKHIEKVDLIFHCLSVESENLIRDYKTVVNELSSYNKKLLDKKTVILLTKVDLIDQKEVIKKTKELEKFGRVILISIYNEESINSFKKILSGNSFP